jgi:calcium-translocating P-type ATPase
MTAGTHPVQGSTAQHHQNAITRQGFMNSSQWYQQSIDQVAEKLNTSVEGLGLDDAKRRLEKYGPNRLPEARGVSAFVILLRQFASPLIYILMVAAVVTFFLEEYKDTIVITAVLVLNAVIGFIQEYRAEESMMALKKMVVPRARIVREGNEREANSDDLVPGDVVVLASGSKVPADIRLFSSLELKVDESMLTGESVPVEKTAEAIMEPNLTPGDQRNMAFTGSVVVNGRARGFVVETASRTVLGGIAGEVRGAQAVKAPLLVKFHRFSNKIGIVVLAASILLFVIGILIGEPLKDMFITMVAAAVAAIPEGLPIVLTIALAVGVQRMARRNAIIRKLPAVETLGSTTVICTDKTGTLTKNEMTVKVVYDGEHVFDLTGTGYEPTGEILHEWVVAKEEERQHLFMCFRVGLLCNESSLYEEEGETKVDGDPTEGALIVSAMKAGLHPEKERSNYRQLALIPFESDRGYMATLHAHGDERIIFVKGAPEKILELCTTCMAKDGLRTEEILHTSHLFATEGMRVLAMAYKKAPAGLDALVHGDVEGDLVLAGIQGMIDPPREEAVAAVKGCRQAGIRVVMITGDHPTTALAIGRQVGIARENDRVLTGRDLMEMNDDELSRHVREVSIYARVAPDQKLRIVRLMMAQGEIVAVTGDGVNDAPALKAAHIGVAMGKKGTDVAKEASGMVILDDNFATIFKAVEDGRIVFENVRKVVFFLIPTGVAAIGSIVGTLMMGIPIPYLPSQLLWINLVTNGIQDVALAFEPGGKDIVKRPPFSPREGVMSSVLVQRTVIVGLLISIGIVYNFTQGLDSGLSLEKARTVAVTTMVFFQFFQAWNSRSETESVFKIPFFSNPFLFYGLLTAFFVHLAAIYLPSLQWLLRMEPLNGSDWMRIVFMSLTVIVVVEIDKYVRKRKSAVVTSAVQ